MVPKILHAIQLDGLRPWYETTWFKPKNHAMIPSMKYFRVQGLRCRTSGPAVYLYFYKIQHRSTKG